MSAAPPAHAGRDGGRAPSPSPSHPPATPSRAPSPPPAIYSPRARPSSSGTSTPRRLHIRLPRHDSEMTLARADSQMTLCHSPTTEETPHKVSPLRRHSPLPSQRDQQYNRHSEDSNRYPASPDYSPPLSPAPTLAPTPARRRSEDGGFPFGLQHIASNVVSENEERSGPFPDLLPATAPADKVDVLDVGAPPDGGRQAWLCIMSAFLLLCCMFGFVTSMGQLEKYYFAHQLSAYSKSQVAWIATVQSTLTFASSILFGRIFDAHGPKILVWVGTTLSVVALVAVSFSTKYYHFLLAHALFGFATSVIWSPAAAVSGHWFLKRRATAIGIVGCGSGIGGIIYPILLKTLLGRFKFTYAILIVAAMNTALVLPSWFFLRTRLPTRKPVPWRAMTAPWREAQFTFLALGAGLCMLNMFSPYFDAPIMAAANKLPPNVGDYSIAILQAGSFVGRASSGVIADRFGAWRVYLGMALMAACVLFAFWCATPMPTTAACFGMAMYGFASGAWITLVSAVTAAISPTSEIGMRIGMVWTAVSLPILVGPVICGMLVEMADGKFTYAGIFCGATYLVGALVTCVPQLIAAFRGRGKNTDEESASDSSSYRSEKKSLEKHDTMWKEKV